MMYYSNELINWFKRLEKRNVKNTTLSMIFACFVGLGMFFDCRQQMSNKFIFGLSGIIGIIIFFIYVYFRTARIINNTIREIEVMDTRIIFTTFSYKMMNVYMIYEKNIVVDFVNLNFSKIEYPLNDTKHKLERECFKIIIDDVEFYLLYKYFNDIESVIKKK